MLVLKNKNIKFLFCFLILASVFCAGFFIFNNSVLAVEDYGDSLTTNINIPRINLILSIVKIVNYVLGLLGLIAVVLVIYAGFIWMNAGGDATKVDKAKKILTNALIGLAIILLSGAITLYVFNVLSNKVADYTGGNGGNGPGGNGSGGVALPENIFRISSITTSCEDGENYADDVFRCSLVSVNFNHSLDENSVKSAVNNEKLIIEKCNDSTCNSTSKLDADFKNVFTGNGNEWVIDNKSAIFAHNILFEANTYYRLLIPTSIKDKTGLELHSTDACSSGFGTIENCELSGGKYNWIFRVGSQTDSEPPVISSSYPVSSSESNYPDSSVSMRDILWVKFSEAINPQTINKDNIKIRKVDGQVNANGVGGTVGNYFAEDEYDVEINSAGNGFEIVFDQALVAYSWYQIEILEIQDLCRNKMVGISKWRFGTKDNESLIKKVYPSNNYTKACPDTRVYIVFNKSMYNPKTASCEVLGLDKGGIVYAGSLLPNSARVFNVVDDYTDASKDPNDYCRRYEFLPTSKELTAGESYKANVLGNLKTDNLGHTMEVEWSFKVLDYESCENETDEEKLRIISNTSCVEDGESVISYPSPNPYNNSKNVCLNSMISARFNKKVNAVNFELGECIGEVLDPCSQIEKVNGQTLIENYDSNSSYFKFIPNENLNASQTYLAQVKRATSESGEILENENWKFETYNNASQGNCDLKSVAILPARKKIKISESSSFIGEVFGLNCQQISVNNLNWQWSVEDENICGISNINNEHVDVTGVSKGTSRLYISVGGKLDSSFIVVSNNDEELIECSSSADMCSVDDSLCPVNYICHPDECICLSEGDLPNLEILNFGPKNNLECTNYALDILFNAKVDMSSLKDNLILSSGGDEIDVNLKNINLKNTELGCSNEKGCSLVKIYPKEPFEKGKNYTLLIENGVTGLQGGVLASDKQNIYTINSSASICSIDKVSIMPDEYNFTYAGQEKDFNLVVMDNKETELSPQVGVYDWDIKWNESDKDNIILITNSTNNSEKVTARNLNGRAVLVGKIIVTEDVVNYTQDKEYTGLANITTNLCLNPWPADGQPYVDNNSYGNFSLFYCRDSGLGQVCLGGDNPDKPCIDDDDCPNGTCQLDDDDLPAMNKPKVAPAKEGVLKEYELFRSDNDDLIGIKVYANEKHLSVLDWLKSKGFDTSGFSEINVGGYQAMQEENSVYVSAATLGGNKLYTNIYLLSYNSNADTVTQEIFNQVLDNIEFNVNMFSESYPICKIAETYCNSDFDCQVDLGDKCLDERAKIARDTRRLADLASISTALEDYKSANGFYPKLEAGSYELGHSTSKWPSWNAILNSELGITLPIDPLNKFKLPCHATENDKYDEQSCWNDTDEVFMCPIGSQIYQYYARGTGENLGTNFDLYATMEYIDSGSWKNYTSSSCENYSY